MRKIKISILILSIFVLLACNFPLFIPSMGYGEIPFPTGINVTPTLALSSPDETRQIIIHQPLVLGNGYFSYYTQSGDTLEMVSRHFNVSAQQITSPQPLRQDHVLPPGQLLQIPDAFGHTFSADKILPDSEVIFSPGASDFDVTDFVNRAGGYLSVFHQQVGNDTFTGAEIVKRVARSTSVNPRLLLAVIEFRSGWVTNTPSDINLTSPLRFYYQDQQGFYLECALAAKWINAGFYGWRHGTFTDLNFPNGDAIRVEPQLNAGTVALWYFMSQLHPLSVWQDRLYGPNNLAALYTSMFGNPWVRAQAVEPLFTDGVTSPTLDLPFGIGEEWALTGGLHYSWNSGTPSGALDFAPNIKSSPCSVSTSWARAAAPGKVSYSDYSIVIIDVMDDQQNPTGWQLFYMHIAARDRIRSGTIVKGDDPIGHPSCEGGISTGTHFHFARMYKGEWIAAGDPFPFILSGWTALPGTTQFRSSLVKGTRIVTARQDGGTGSIITR